LANCSAFRARGGEHKYRSTALYKPGHDPFFDRSLLNFRAVPAVARRTAADGEAPSRRARVPARPHPVTKAA
jgi:hypothetical protein